MCLWCRQSTAKRNKYCSNKCQQAYQTKKKLDDWLAGGNGGDVNGELNRMFKRYLVDEAGGKCSECGWGEVNPYSGKVTLTIDHIDGDAQNNKRDNLVVLCYNCHTLTPTFNQLNRGKGTRNNVPGTRRQSLNSVV